MPCFGRAGFNPLSKKGDLVFAQFEPALWHRRAEFVLAGVVDYLLIQEAVVCIARLNKVKAGVFCVMIVDMFGNH